MKNQYLGDINDFCKYALLRLLAAGDNKIGVLWMLTPDDEGNDGNLTAYLENESRWARHDEELFRKLEVLHGRPGPKSVAMIEADDIIPRASYFDRIIPDAADERQKIFHSAFDKFSDRDLIFFDPDNGLEVKSKRKGRKNSCKYLYREEVKEAFEKGHSLLIYQHFPHVQRDMYLRDRKTQIKGWTGAQDVIGLCTGRVCFFLVPQRGRTDYFRKKCAEFVNKWSDCFYSADTET